MSKWNKQLENEITLLVKDWLRQKGKTQKDLSIVLNSPSERMPAIIESLRKEFSLGGLPKLASLLCEIEAKWTDGTDIEQDKNYDPFGQLDLLLEEINEDCNN